MRFTNNDVRYNINVVVNEILRTVENRIPELKTRKKTKFAPHPSPLPSGERKKD
jgi:hypothetical protein